MTLLVAVPSLVTNVPKANNEVRSNGQNYTSKGWSKQRKRGYHRILSLLSYWRQRGYRVLWLMLSTSKEGDSTQLAYHHRRLKQEAERADFGNGFGFEDIEHAVVRTSEGNGVLHVFWAWRKNGFRNYLFYVPQGWLSDMWRKIHQSPIVWITKTGNRQKDNYKLSNYCATQYCAEQEKFERLSWSWFKIVGLPARWTFFKRHFKVGLYRAWHRHLAGFTLIVSTGCEFYRVRPPPYVPHIPKEVCWVHRLLCHTPLSGVCVERLGSNPHTTFSPSVESHRFVPNVRGLEFGDWCEASPSPSLGIFNRG